MNEFEDVPIVPSSSPTVVARSARSGSVSVSDIKDFISPKLYGELSWDENRSADDVTLDCIERAKVLAESLLHLVGEPLNVFSETQNRVVKLLTIYELYLYNGDKRGGEHYLKQAERIISDRYHSIEKERESVQPVVSVHKPKRS